MITSPNIQNVYPIVRVIKYLTSGYRFCVFPASIRSLSLSWIEEHFRIILQFSSRRFCTVNPSLNKTTDEYCLSSTFVCLCVPLVHLSKGMFFRFSYQRLKIFILQRSTDIQTFYTLRYCSGTRKDYMKWSWRTIYTMCGSELELILIFFLYFSPAEAISHTSCVGGGYWTQVSWASSPRGPPPASIWAGSGLDTKITKTMQNNKLFSNHSLFAISRYLF